MSYRGWKRTVPLLAPAAFLAGGAPVPAVAQQPAALEEIVVTAQRRETELQETPVAVTVFSGDKIEDLGIFDITDLTGRAPNTTILRQPASNSNMDPRIRGVGAGETSLLIDPKVGLYLDGAYVSKTVGAALDLIDLESIQVLRGPQGTLFGRNSTGGALIVASAKPSGEMGAKLKASVGNDGYQRYMGAVDLPVVPDILSARVSGMLTDNDGWAKNVYPGRESGLATEDNQSWRVAVQLTPVDRITVDYAFDQTDNKGYAAPFQIVEVKDSLYDGFNTTPFPFATLGGELFAAMAATVGDPDQRREEYNLDYSGLAHLDAEGHTLTATVDLDAVTLKYIFANRQSRQHNEGTDLDGGAYIARDRFYADSMPVPSPGFHANMNISSVEMTTHEIQLLGELLEGRLHFTLGYYNYDEDVYEDNPQSFSLPIAFMIQQAPILAGAYARSGFCNDVPGLGPVCIGSQRLPLPFSFRTADPNGNGFVDFIYGQDSKSWAVYGQFTYSLTDRFDLTGGLRYTEDKKSAFLFNENLGQISFDERLMNAENWDNLSYLVNLSYDVNEDIHIYATHSTSYNAGSFNARALSVTAFASPVRDERVSAIDVGIKADWLNSRLRTNIALFRNKFDDLQIGQFEAGSGGASLRLVNAGKATHQGIELDVVAILAEGLILDLTYGFLDGKFDEYVALNPATDTEADIADVTAIPAPENTASIGLQYDFKPTALGALSLRFDATYTGSTRFHPFLNQHDSAESRWLLDARLSFNDISFGDGDALRISLWVKNLADKEFREWGIDFATLGFAGATWGRPRSYGIDLVYQLGQ